MAPFSLEAGVGGRRPAPDGAKANLGGYNHLFSQAGTVMEAERLNAVANRIADLSDRGDQLRRYL